MSTNNSATTTTSPSKFEDRYAGGIMKRFVSNRRIQWILTIAFVGGIMFLLSYQQSKASTTTTKTTSRIKSLVRTDQQPINDNLNDKQKQFRPIKQISILGERNSGTRWTAEYVYCYFLVFCCCYYSFVLLTMSSFAISLLHWTVILRIVSIIHCVWNDD